MNLERISTGVSGLDRLVGGGYLRKTVNLIIGGAGVGKTIFCMQFLINGITRYNEPGIYVTFEEDKENLYRNMLEFGWDLTKLEKQGKFVFIHYTPEKVKKMLDEGGGEVSNAIEKLNAKRLVFDSISSFTLLFKNMLLKKEATLQLFELLRKWKCTSLLTGEYEPHIKEHYSTELEFEVDGIIILYNVRKEDIRERAIEILKMRGTKHSNKIFPFEITKKGIIVDPEGTVSYFSQR
jgi:KaiC/GvpD/RAD55 family RecA-like ATPase